MPFASGAGFQLRSENITPECTGIDLVPMACDHRQSVMAQCKFVLGLVKAGYSC